MAQLLSKELRFKLIQGWTFTKLKCAITLLRRGERLTGTRESLKNKEIGDQKVLNLDLP